MISLEGVGRYLIELGLIVKEHQFTIIESDHFIREIFMLLQLLFYGAGRQIIVKLSDHFYQFHL